MEIEDLTLPNLIILDGDYRIIIMMETKIIRETKIVTAIVLIKDDISYYNRPFVILTTWVCIYGKVFMIDFIEIKTHGKLRTRDALLGRSHLEGEIVIDD